MDKIEKRVVLKAPMERVWRAVSDSKQFGVWFGVELDGPFVAGKPIKGRMQPTQVKKSELTIAPGVPMLVTEGAMTLSASFVLLEIKLEWFKMLKASKRSSSLMFSYLGIAMLLCKEASNFTNGDPRPASLPRLPLMDLNVTGSPVTMSTAPVFVTPAGAAKAFWIPLHCAVPKPAVIQAATAPGPNNAFVPSKEAMLEVLIVPSAATLGRC